MAAMITQVREKICYGCVPRQMRTSQNMYGRRVKAPRQNIRYMTLS